MKKSFFVLVSAVLLFGVCMSTLSFNKHADALSGYDWKAGRIIDDTIFNDKNTMSIADVQAFLNAKVGTGGYDSVPGQCDTNGARNASPYNSNASRATYAASIGKPTKWTCLNNYYEVPKTTPGPGIPINNYGSSTIPPGAKSAAELIWNAAQTYNISPMVLLVTIQKESSGPLTTDDWPWQSQYTYAMGAHCPDSGPNGSANCDPNYSGFSIQISESAALLRYYLDNMSAPWWPYKKPGNNVIQFNPSTNCGSSSVVIENPATAALYTYTPYQPNTAALNNLYGLGDGCSAYGNRNFWRIYNDWFGPSTTLLGGITMTVLSQPPTTTTRGQSITYSFSLTNTLASSVTLDAVGAVGRAGSLIGTNRDLGWQGPVTLAPDTTQTFTFTAVVQDTGVLYVWPAANYKGTYVQYNNWGSTINIVLPNFSVSGTTFTDTIPAKGESLGASFTVTNNLSVPIDINGIGVVGRLNSVAGSNRDIGWQGPAHFNAGETKTFSGFSRLITDVGTHYYWAGILYQGNYIQYNNWGSTIVSHAPNLSLSQPLTMSPTTVYAGQDVTFSAELTNNEPHDINYDAIGIPVKFYDTYGYDAVWVGPGVIATGAKLPISGTRNIDKPGPFTYWVSNNFGGTYTTLGSVPKFNSLPAVPNFSVSGITFTNTTPAKGETLGATFSITNTLPVGIDVSAVGVVGRLNTFSGLNRDLGWQGPIHFNAHETKTFSGITGFSRIITDIGTHYYWIGVLYQGNYIQYNNWGSTIVSH
jgi:hypothetical protein